MAENRISLNIPEADQTEIQAAIQTLQDKLMPHLLTLSADERKGLPKMGDKSFTFVKDAQKHMIQNPTLVPGYLDLAELEVDLQAVDLLESYLNLLKKITQGLDDTSLLAGSEALTTSLSFYAAVKGASKQKAPGAKVVYDDLKRYFAGRGKRIKEE